MTVAQCPSKKQSVLRLTPIRFNEVEMAVSNMKTLQKQFYKLGTKRVVELSVMECGEMLSFCGVF